MIEKRKAQHQGWHAETPLGKKIPAKEFIK
jgi:hypothetical protein